MHLATAVRLLPLLALAAGALSACAGPRPPPGPAAPPIEVAITFDDLPAHGPLAPGATHEQLLARIAAVLDARGIRATGFVTGGNGADHPPLRAALGRWVAAGQAIGNHGWSHLDLERAAAADYLADVDRGEALLRELARNAPDATWRTYRYPYLSEGPDVATRAAVREALDRRGYRVAPVTVDFHDWAFHAAWARCAERGDAAALERLGARYVESGVAALRWSDAAARELFGRPAKQVLLLHPGVATAARLDALLAAYERTGARFVTLSAALEDEALRVDPGEAHTRDLTLLEQLQRARGRTDPPPPPPAAELEAVCR